MVSLIDLVATCRAATEAHVKVRFAGEIVTRVGPMLRVYVAKRCPAEVVDDVLQEVLMVIATGVDGFQGRTESQFWHWCYRIASFKTADHFRDIEGEPTLSLDVEEVRRAAEATYVESPPAPGERLDLQLALELLLQSKPPCVGLLVAHFIEELDYQDLAEMLEVKPATIRMRIKRCLALAQELVGQSK